MAEGSAVYPEVLYDLAVIRFANDDREGALAALEKAVEANPRLAKQARSDPDLKGLNDDVDR